MSINKSLDESLTDYILNPIKYSFGWKELK